MGHLGPSASLQETNLVRPDSSASEQVASNGGVVIEI